MPYMTNGKRDYKKEGAWDRAQPNRKEDRADRNAARYSMIKDGHVARHDGKDVGHVKALSKGGDGRSKSNLAVQSPSENRSFARHKDGSMKSEKSKREKK